MKTNKAWNESKLDFGRFAQAGDQVDQDIVDYFLGVVPPKTMQPGLIQCGEPYSFNDKQRTPTYTTFKFNPNKEVWYFLGDITQKDAFEYKF